MLFKHSGKYVNIYFNMKITFQKILRMKQEKTSRHLSSSSPKIELKV